MLFVRRIVNEEAIVLKKIESGERIFVDDGLAESRLTQSCESAPAVLQVGPRRNQAFDSRGCCWWRLGINYELRRIGSGFQPFERRNIDVMERQIERRLYVADRRTPLEARNRPRVEVQGGQRLGGIQLEIRQWLNIRQLLEFRRRLLVRRCRGPFRRFRRESRSLKSFDLGSRLLRGPTDIEEHETTRVSLDGRLGPPGLDTWIEGADSLHSSFRLGRPSLGVERFMENLQLFDRLGGLPGFGELIGEHQPDVVLPRAKIREFLESLECVGVPAGAVHPVGVLEEILLGVAVEAFFGRDLTELVVDLMARRGVAENLVAERDGVVEVATLRVKIHGLLVIIDGLVGLVQAQIEVANPIVDGHIAVVVAFGLFDDLKVDLERFIELLFLLEFGSLFFQLVDV